ncbi:hypothetical protein KY290_010625 [Solanum tuberosum]|uniref:Integrase core domain containing protein n=1 Tax=Solanum tuberosum TaxID=4113 RepID=A0ABQ7W0C0_SOLTU|nr:hypothetical protein KY290_010625 [Solanum tuberosum]
MESSGRHAKTTSEPPSLAAAPNDEQPDDQAVSVRQHRDGATGCLSLRQKTIATSAHASSNDGEHRQQPTPASNINKRRRHPREDNDAVPNEQQPLPLPSLFSGRQQRLHTSLRRITARALKLRPTAMNTI